MNTLIATRGRAGKVKLLTWFNESHPEGVILFVEPQEEQIYRLQYQNLKIVPIGLRDQGLSYVRNFIYQYAIGNEIDYFWMHDDDIKDFFRREGNKMIKLDTPYPFLVEMENRFIHQGFYHAGLEYQQFAWSATAPFVLNSFCDNAVWFNMKLLKTILPTPPYRKELKVKVDRDFCMQVIAGGGITARSTELAFATPADGSNTGGLKELVYDKPGWEEEAVDQLIKIWGVNVVTKFTKPTGRVDARINWKALNSSQQSINNFVNPFE